MGRACSTDTGKKECIEDFGGKARTKETTRKNLDISGRILLKWILEQ
jgi:hypothetical protein